MAVIGASSGPAIVDLLPRKAESFGSVLSELLVVDAVMRKSLRNELVFGDGLIPKVRQTSRGEPG